MADDATTQESNDSTADTTAAESQTEEQSQASQEGAGTDSSSKETSSTGESTETASTGDKSTSENKDAKQEFKPVSRRSAAYRIQQLVKENQELKQQQKPAQQDVGDTWQDESNDTPNVEALVAKEVERRLNPVISEHSKTADDGELSELFSGNKAGQRTEYEPQIRKMWELPQYRDVAASDLHAMLIGRNIDSIVSKAVADGLEKAKQADKEAKESSASGTSNSNRTGKRGGPDTANMTAEQLQAHNDRVKAGLTP